MENTLLNYITGASVVYMHSLIIAEFKLDLTVNFNERRAMCFDHKTYRLCNPIIYPSNCPLKILVPHTNRMGFATFIAIPYYIADRPQELILENGICVWNLGNERYPPL